MIKKMVLAVLCMATMASTLVFANTPVINSRERRQMARIHQGVKKGQLTTAQAAALKQQVKDVKKEKSDMIKANGGKPLTGKQRRLLRKDLNQNSRKIYQGKHAGNATSTASGN